MKIRLEQSPHFNIKVAMNRLGYHEHTDRRTRSTSYIRRLQSLQYPRFHVYIEELSNGISINVHFDEKKPSYGNSPRHSGQYDSELVQKEAERIQNYLTSL